MIFDRLRRALREQNWFAVVLEICIVVLGVVIGFQVTAWGQDRAHRAQEQIYLHQLAADLRETERLATDADSVMAPREREASLILRAFYTAERPQPDSLHKWLAEYGMIRHARPVVGTAEALVATGDLSLVRDDSLRSAITGYLEDAREEATNQAYYSGIWHDILFRLARLVDSIPYWTDTFRPEARESTGSLPRHETPFFEGERRTPFPFDAEQFLSDRDALHAVFVLNVVTANLRRSRDRMRTEAAALRERVEAELNR
jgi:hypothetical protein